MNRFALAAALAGIAGGAHARAPEYRLDYGLTATAGYSDNLYRTSQGSGGDVFSSFGGTIDYRNQSRRVDAEAKGDLAYYLYSGNAGNELTGYFDGRVALGIVPEKFLWVFANNFAQGIADPLQPASPGNTEGINHFSTGPDFIFRFDDSTSARLSGRYGNVWYQNTLGDNNRYSGQLSLERRLSARSSVGLAGDVESVQFTQPGVGPDYDKYEGYLTYRTEGARTGLTLDAGYTEISGGKITDNGPLVRLSINRVVSPSSSVFIGGGYQYNDSGNVAGRTLPSGTPGVPSNVLTTPEPYLDAYGSMGWAFKRARTHISLDLSYHDLNYLGTGTNDQTSLQFIGKARLQFIGKARRDLSERFSLELRGWFNDVNYQNLFYIPQQNLYRNGDYTEWDLRATLSWRVLRTLSLQFSGDHWNRSGSGPNNSQDENRLWVGATWSPRAIDHSLDVKTPGSTSGL